MKKTIKVQQYLILLLVTVIFLGSCATAEVRAVRKGDLQKIEKFLSKGGDPNTVDADGNSLIHIAVQYGQPGSLERLLIAGANPNLLNNAGDTAAIMAVGMNRNDMVNILLNFDADMKIPGNRGKTTLMLAAANGNIQLLERLLSAQVPIDAKDRSGSTAIFYSISSKNSEALSFLLDSGANAKHIDNNGRNPLHLMSQNRHSTYAGILLAAGTNPSQKQETTGETPLHIASGSGAWELVELYLAYGAERDINLNSTKLGAPLFYALKPEIPSSAAIKTIRLLLNTGADPNLPSIKEILPIVFAVEKLDVPRVELLIDSGARLDIRLSERRSILHLATSRDIPEIISILIDSGINPDLKDLNGNTALFISVEKESIKAVEVLLAKGADPKIINNAENSALLIPLERDAGQNRGLSAMTNLLIRYEAPFPQGKETLKRLLLLTARSGNADVADLLLTSGANPNESSANGMTILMLASSRNFTELSEVLLKWGARVNMRDDMGNTAMHFSSRAGSVEGVELLLHYGENPDPVNYEKLRPVQLAPENDRGLRIIEILLAAGAQPLPVEIPAEETPTEETPTEETPTEETPTEETPTEETPTVVDSSTEENNNDDVIEESTISENEISEELWSKARVLILGENEPRGISDRRIIFPDFSAQVPESYPKNLTSKSNPREVVIYIWNETPYSAEIYQVKTDSNTEAVSVLASGEITEIKTRQGNVFPVYSEDNLYFGEIKTTGQEDQFYRLIQEN